ncbi:PREDICTED: caspase recruitment domain-containing protein 8-like [Cyprinodon variegatus]|uniref:caspase recruitment domain-containing protein 8-like n=1 Tax=Cyprinodon variegatus TaxID=28743 RepID=UPI000742C768|nr:PREDICTED: caspase recruitment domain-containing protein 8-like [Cyprinodon variegatus]
MKLPSSFEEFTPDFTDDEDDGTYVFRCSSPGLYQCRESGLVFDMKGEGDVSYRIVPWERRLLSQHGKKPAGPLFDISCQQQSVAQLHLPHCEIHPTEGCNFLSVAHIHDEGIEFIRPEKITETHLIISITGFSAFGNVKEEDSPLGPIRALVLLFYKPPVYPNVRSYLNILLLPKNIVTRNVKRTRKKLFGLETFIDVPPNCKLWPDRLYTLSTDPGNDLVWVQPTEAEFDAESNNCETLIQVTLEDITGDIELSLKEKSDSSCVWKRRVRLSPQGLKRGLTSAEQLKNIRTKIIEGITNANLQKLLDRLFDVNVLTYDDKEFIRTERATSEKNRALVDTVMNKGDQASSEMIHLLCGIDPCLSRELGLICENPEPN